MMQLLERVSKMGITVLVVTHEHELVHRFHQRVVTLSHAASSRTCPQTPWPPPRTIFRWMLPPLMRTMRPLPKKEVTAV